MTKLRFFISILIPLFAVFVFMSLIINGFYNTEYEKKPIIKDKIESMNTGYLYDFYIAGYPNIENRDYYGSKNASITMVAFLDIGSNASRYFISKVFPKLKMEYIDKSKVRFYSKEYLIKDDVSGKSDKFIYAKSLSCVNQIKKDSYYEFYFNMFNLSDSGQISMLTDKYNIDSNLFKDCMDKLDFENIKEYYSEIENFGLVGIVPVFYIGINGRSNTILFGVPGFEKFNRTIRQFEVMVGD